MQFTLDSSKIKKGVIEYVENKDKYSVELFCQIYEVANT